jgi:1,4-dihydroxy-2-naphthoate octaprenyltransferase
MNIRMWIKALQIIPRINKEEWDHLDVVARWLIATRAAALVVTFASALIAGLLAWRDGSVNFLWWFLLLIGLYFAHGTNNLINDWVDARKGVDDGNYFRTQYGPQPVQQGLMSRRQTMTYIAVSGLVALTCGLFLVVQRGGLAWWLLAIGVVFVLFYTWPFKWIGLGEISVLAVWGPLMVGGGYYILSGNWDWMVVLASLPPALGTTMAIFGKHIDKLNADKTKGIHTLPVLLGDRTSRMSALGMMAIQYMLVIYLVAIDYFSPALLVVFLSLTTVPMVWNIFKAPKPAIQPSDYPPSVWPLYYVAAGFYFARRFVLLYLLGVILDIILHLTGVVS